MFKNSTYDVKYIIGGTLSVGRAICRVWEILSSSNAVYGNSISAGGIGLTFLAVVKSYYCFSVMNPLVDERDP